MSCNHRYVHGCDRPLPLREWYEDYGCRPRRYRDEVVVLHDDCDDEERPRRRGSRRGRRCRDEDSSTAVPAPISLHQKAAALREELATIEDELDALPDETRPRPVD